MDIFLSWHGSSSHALAEILRDWLPTVLPQSRPWLSSEDIGKGKPWDPELARRLEATSHAIVCVTAPQVARAPWVNFEAGAVSKYVDHAHVSPLLVGVSPEDLGGLPLSRFQCTRFDKEDVGRLLRSINASASPRLKTSVLQRNLHNTWDQLDEEVRRLDRADSVRPSQHTDDDYNENENDQNGAPRIADVEEDILLFIAEFDSDDDLFRPDLDDVCEYTRENRIRVEHHMDNLANHGMLRGGSGLGYTVTAEGRAYLVDHGLV